MTTLILGQNEISWETATQRVLILANSNDELEQIEKVSRVTLNNWAKENGARLLDLEDILSHAASLDYILLVDDNTNISKLVIMYSSKIAGLLLDRPVGMHIPDILYLYRSSRIKSWPTFIFSHDHCREHVDSRYMPGTVIIP